MLRRLEREKEQDQREALKRLGCSRADGGTNQFALDGFSDSDSSQLPPVSMHDVPKLDLTRITQS
jgi:hypothetical protein